MAQKHISSSNNAKTTYTLHTLVVILHAIGKPFGMAPYQLPTFTMEKLQRQTQDESENTWGLIIDKIGIFDLTIICSMSVLVLTTFVFLSDARMHDESIIGTDGPATGQILLEVTHSWRMLSAVATAWTFIARRAQLASALSKLWDIDVKMRNLGGNPPYLYHCIFCVIIFVGALTSKITLAIIDFVTEDGKNPKYIALDLLSDGVQFIVHFIVLLQFNLYVVILYGRFGFINRCVESLRGDRPKENLSNSARSRDINTLAHCKPSKVMAAVCDMYESLCYGAEDMNAVCTVPLFTTVIINFTELLLLGYLYFFEKISFDDARFGWTITYIIFMFITLLTTGMVKGEVQSVTRHLAESDICYSNQEMSAARNTFLLQTLQHTVDFSACGFFPVEVSALLGQMGVCISLLLFLFQLANKK